MQTFKNLLFILTSRERKGAAILLLMMLVTALLDMIGVASVLPFIAVLTNPSIIETNSILNYMFETSFVIGVESSKDFLFFLGVLVFVTLVLSLAFKAFTIYLQVRFIELCEYSISKRLVEKYLYQPYSWFLNQHSADLGTSILSEVSQLTGGGIRPLLELIAKGMITIALVTLLIIADPKLALVVGFTLAAAYILIFYFIRKHLNRSGKERLKNNRLRYMVVSEAFNAAKEVKVGGLEKIYIDLFSSSAKIFAQTSSFAQVMAQLPRYALEIIAFGGILLIILYMMGQSGSLNNALPIISLYVFAGYRLMPALQQIYTSFNTLTFIGPSIDKITKDFEDIKLQKFDDEQITISLNKNISLENIYYNYPNTSRTALKNININIPAKSIVGLVGPTGSGKTTIVDIILGLLESQKGSLKVDEKIITNKNSRSWQRSLGYVPQQIFLSDDTIESNIAFGIKPKDIDKEKLKNVSKIANLHEFIINELPNKYQTKIGERGVRLSGGQRQRIGIARALYHNPQVLILDEATSALDNQTEKAVMDAVNNLSRDITVILITHRLSTVKKCDQIFLIEKGEIKNKGTFQELIIADENFRKSANS